MSALPGPSREMGKALLVLGVFLIAVGAFLLSGAKLPLRLGRLPGDILYQKRNTTVYFPIVTCILLSAVLTLLFWLTSLFRR